MRWKIPGAVAAVGALLTLWWTFSSSFALVRELRLAQGTGGIAALLLLASLLTSPLDRFGLLLRAQAVALRRTFGISAALAGVAHALVVAATPLAADLRLFVYEPHLRAGSSALVVLLVLAATSFPDRLKVRGFELLHRLVYAAGLLVLLHLSLSSHARQVVVLGFAAALVLAFGLRLIRRSRPA